MSPHIEKLARLIGAGIMIEVDRKPLDPHKLLGYVVGVSEKLLLLHVVDGCTLMLNGYSAVRLKDIASFRLDSSFISRAMYLSERQPRVPEGIDVSNFKALLASAGERHPLVTVALEQKDPGCIFIGKETGRTDKKLELKKLCTKGRWRAPEKYAFKDITMVTFDDGYVRALAQLLEQDAQGK